jgi:rod shape-determining protein MreC
MRNLWLILWRLKHIFLFLLLEAIALFMLYQNSLFQQTLFYNVFVGVDAKVSSIRKGIVGYFHLKKENELLRKENAYLHSLLKTSFVISYQATFVVNDTLFRQRYAYMPATVIRNTTQYKDNYIIIDKGKAQGVKEGFGVFSPEGVVGIVDHVTENYAVVRSFLHSKFVISAQIKGKPSVGNVTWSGKDFYTGYLHDIPLHIKPAEGDTIITSPYSDIFPAGIFVGFIKKMEIDETNSFYRIEFRLAADFSNLSTVYVVTNLLKDEQEEIKQFQIENQ